MLTKAGRGWIDPIPRRMTSHQTGVIDYIRKEVKAGNGFPSNRQIMQKLNLDHSVVTQVLLSLCDRGLIRTVSINPTARKGQQKYTWALAEDRRG